MNWLSHHTADELHRCYRLGGRHVCARCLGTYPVLLLSMTAHLAARTGPSAEWDLAAVLLVVPATVDWAYGRFRPFAHSNAFRTLTGVALGLGLGRSLSVHVQAPLPPVLLAQGALVLLAILPVVFVTSWRAGQVDHSPPSAVEPADRQGVWVGPQTSDEQLMLAYKSGDARAFATLVQRHRAAVFNFILRYVGHRQRAEDVLQETWLKVVRNSSSYEPKARFTTWVFTVARNLCVDQSRKDGYRQSESLDAPVGDDDGRSLAEVLPDEDGATPDRAADNARMRPVLERAIRSLPEEQREVFMLREYNGIGFKEIAEVTGVNENTVKSRMRYALEGLRKRLLEAGVEVDGALTPAAGTAVSQ